MADEYVTTKQFTALERRMDEGFAEIKALIADLKHAVELERRDDHAKYDDRYVLREEAMQDAIMRLGQSEFRKACYPIVAEYLCSEEGKERIGFTIDAHNRKTRDNITKWIDYIKGLLWLAMAIAMLYGGITVGRNQEAIKMKQEVLSNQIEQLN